MYSTSMSHCSGQQVSSISHFGIVCPPRTLLSHSQRHLLLGCASEKLEQVHTWASSFCLSKKGYVKSFLPSERLYFFCALSYSPPFRLKVDIPAANVLGSHWMW